MRRQKAFHANDPASPTAAADEDGVVVFFADFGLAAYTPDGKDRWTLPLGPFKSFYGMAGSPVLTGDLVVLLCDQRSGSFLIALDRKTGCCGGGETRPGHRRMGHADGVPTRTRTTATQNSSSSARRGSRLMRSRPASRGGGCRWDRAGRWVRRWPAATRSSCRHSDPPNRLCRLSPATCRSSTRTRTAGCRHREFSADKEMGEHFGWIDADGDDFITEKEWNTTRDLALGDYGTIAVRPAGARGKLDPAAVLWRFKKNLPYIPAPLIYQDVLYLVKTGGIITSFDPANGPSAEGRTEPGRARRVPTRRRSRPTARCSWQTSKARSRS